MQGKRNGKTRFNIRMAETGEIEDVRWKLEEGGGLYRVHKIIKKGLDLNAIMEEGTDDQELFQRFYKCGIEELTV